MTKQYSQDDLNKVLWSAADSARGTVDAVVYKDYALTMLFFKYLSDKFKLEKQNLKQRFGDDADRIEAKMKSSRFYIPADSSFDEVYAKIEDDNIGEIINVAMRTIENHNKAKLEGVFRADFNNEAILGKPEQRNKMIRNLLKDFHAIELGDVTEDIVGDAYMYLIEKFGAGAGKKAGEFFTKREVAELVARLARPQSGDRIADPTAGSGGLLLLAGEEVRKQGSNNFALYGQESNGTTYQLCRMNMFLHGMDSAHIERGDTINNPLLLENDALMKFDVCVANPPFSQDKWGAENAADDKYNRFWRGIPPKSTGDYAFITHMIETLKPQTGRMAVVVPHGVLFRSGAEGKIRQKLLEENLIDAVIGLPGKLFQTTDIPVAILVIDRSREKGGARQNDQNVLFIEASKEFVPNKPKNMLTQANADKIFDAFVARQEVEKFAHLATQEEIKENDFNLNITRYVDTFEEEPEVDIQATLAEIEKLNPELERLERQMNVYLKELGIKNE